MANSIHQLFVVVQGFFVFIGHSFLFLVFWQTKSHTKVRLQFSSSLLNWSLECVKNFCNKCQEKFVLILNRGFSRAFKTLCDIIIFFILNFSYLIKNSKTAFLLIYSSLWQIKKAVKTQVHCCENIIYECSKVFFTIIINAVLY